MWWVYHGSGSRGGVAFASVAAAAVFPTAPERVYDVGQGAEMQHTMRRDIRRIGGAFALKKTTLPVVRLPLHRLLFLFFILVLVFEVGVPEEVAPGLGQLGDVVEPVDEVLPVTKRILRSIFSSLVYFQKLWEINSLERRLHLVGPVAARLRSLVLRGRKKTPPK